MAQMKDNIHNEDRDNLKVNNISPVKQVSFISEQIKREEIKRRLLFFGQLALSGALVYYILKKIKK